MEDEVSQLARAFREAALAKEAGPGGRHDRQLHRRMAAAYHQLRAAGPAGQAALAVLLTDPVPLVRCWVAVARLAEGDTSVLGVLEELRQADWPVGFDAEMVLKEHAAGRLGHPFGQPGA